jgi:hypothetical protein
VDTFPDLPTGITGIEGSPDILAFTDKEQPNLLAIVVWGGCSRPAAPVVLDVSAEGISTITYKTVDPPCFLDLTPNTTVVEVPHGITTPKNVAINGIEVEVQNTAQLR